MSAPISLTFDDGPDPVWTPRVLDALRVAGWQATFFVIGPRAQRYPEIVARTLDEGHALEFHCVHHVRHDRLSSARGEAEARRGLAILRGRFGEGVVSRWRPPYGSRADWQQDVARRLGLELTWWDHDTRDYTGMSAKLMAAALRRRLREPADGDGAQRRVLLMHDGIRPSGRRDAAETVRLVGLLAADGVACERL